MKRLTFLEENIYAIICILVAENLMKYWLSYKKMKIRQDFCTGDCASVTHSVTVSGIL